MTIYRIAVLVSILAAAAVGYLWFGMPDLGYGPNEDKAFFAWKHGLQEKSISLGVIVMIVGLLNGFVFWRTLYRGLEDNRVMQTIWGLVAPVSLFFFALAGLYAVAFIEKGADIPVMAGILAACVLGFILNAASLFTGLVIMRHR